MQSYWYAYHLFIMRYSYAGRPFAVALFVWLSQWIKPWAIWDLVHILWISFSKILFLTLAQVCVSFHISFKCCPTSWGEALTHLTVSRTLPFKLLAILPSFSAKTVARVKKLAKKDCASRGTLGFWRTKGSAWWTNISFFTALSWLARRNSPKRRDCS